MMVTPTMGTAVERGDGQADAVDGDGAFVDQVAIEGCGHLKFQPPVAVA